MDSSTGKIVIFVGIVLVIAGLFMYFFHDKLQFLGHLPGDIRIEREHFRFYFPITTMLLLSILINAMIKLMRYFLQ
jgi:hypothetical protein